MSLISLASLVIGILVAFKLMHEGVELLKGHFPDMSAMLPYLSFIIIFILTVIGLYLAGRLLKTTFKITVFLNVADNILGGLFGLLKWGFGVSIILWLTHYVNILIPEDLKKGSLCFYLMIEMAPAMISWFDFLIPYARDLFEMIKENLQ